MSAIRSSSFQLPGSRLMFVIRMSGMWAQDSARIAPFETCPSIAAVSREVR